MAQVRVRVRRRKEGLYIHKDDLLLCLSKFAESPDLNQDQRDVLGALIVDLRQAKFIPDEPEAK